MLNLCCIQTIKADWKLLLHLLRHSLELQALTGTYFPIPPGLPCYAWAQLALTGVPTCPVSNGPLLIFLYWCFFIRTNGHFITSLLTPFYRSIVVSETEFSMLVEQREIRGNSTLKNKISHLRDILMHWDG